jgi:glucose-6-phosphate isomerase
MEIEKLQNPDIRHLSDMKDIVFDKDWAASAGDKELYYMYRGVKSEGDLRYDITVIPAFLMGKEYVKTKGHYHCGSSQEVYSVLEGRAVFLFQKGKDEIEDVYAVPTGKGESVIIPSGYGHITINPDPEETLKLSNWVSEKCVSDYQPIEDKKGACYFYTTAGWVKNNNYKYVPELRFEKPLTKEPEDLSFLK